jgi:hypothetical protein
MANVNDVDSHNGIAPMLRLFFFQSSFLVIILGSHELRNGKKRSKKKNEFSTILFLYSSSHIVLIRSAQLNEDK